MYWGTVKGQRVTGWSIALALVASTSGFIFGYDTGQISGIVLMDDFLVRFGQCGTAGDASTCELPVWREGAIVALLSVGTAVGAILGAPIADTLGRRWAMTTECMIFNIGVVIQTTAFQTWEQVMIGRFISGIGVGALSAACPLYQAETAPKALRGTFTATYQLFITAGILVAACVNIGTRTIDNSASWRVPIALGVVFATFLGLMIHLMPESPRWLEARGRRDQAKAAVYKLYGVASEQEEEAAQGQYQEIADAVESEAQHAQAKWRDCFRPGPQKMLYRTLLGMALQSFQQLTGANYFFYYGATIFLGVGISNSFATQIILNAVNFVCTFGGLYIMERGGRRWPLVIGGIWNAAWFFVFVGVGVTHDPQSDPGAAKAMIVAACMFILGYATTWAPGVWILVGETFPTRTRAKQGALSTLANWIWNFLIAFFTSPITGDIGYYYGLIFAFSNLAGALTVWFFLYESSGLTLEAVDVMYKDPNVKPWQSIHYIPPGFSSRYGNKKSVAGDTSPQDINPEKYANGHSNGYGKNKEGNGVMDHVEHTNGGAHN